jgi:RNA polymerase sigma-70 factor (ECF subfamily)
LLVGAACRGDERAIRTLWERHRGWVATILLAHKPRHAELEDLLQEVAMSYVSNIQSLREPGAFRPWLRTVAVNAARAAARSSERRHRVDAPISDRPMTGPTPAETFQRRDEANHALDRVLSLPEAYREPLLLRAVRGMSYREIARTLNLPETTIETRISRGRRMLREQAPVIARVGGETKTGVHP